MPCDTVRLMPVALEKCDANTMLAALSSLGLAPQLVGDVIQFGNGEYIDTRSGQSRLATLRNKNEIKSAYARATVERTAKRAGWTMQTVAAKQPGQLSFVLAKR